MATRIKTNLARITEIREDIHYKELEILIITEKIIATLKPKLLLLPEIRAARAVREDPGSFREIIERIITYFLWEKRPDKTHGFIEFYESKTDEELEKLIKKLNSILSRVGLISVRNNNAELHNRAINIIPKGFFGSSVSGFLFFIYSIKKTARNYRTVSRINIEIMKMLLFDFLLLGVKKHFQGIGIDFA